MPERKHRCLLISDFNVENFASLLRNDDSLPLVDATVGPFGQVAPLLLERSHECWSSNSDFAIVWTQPEGVVESFRLFLDCQGASLNRLLEEVDEYSSLLLSILDRVSFALVPLWTSSPCDRGLGMLDMKTGTGVSNALMRMNLRLCENLDRAGSIYVLNAQRWTSMAGKDAFNPKLWYMARIPFANEVFIEAVKDVKAALRGIKGGSKKLVILDLDDTLWGGIVGDVGWEHIRLGGHDHIGEAYVDFQRQLKSLTNRGILLAIVSKNDEAAALEPFQKHPEMVLTLEDLAGWKINWGDKAQNIVDLVSDLNLGLQSVVFIDDNPVERARVREALPQVYVPEWPEDKMLYKSALLSFRCFDGPSISKEDRNRTRMYVSERHRRDLMESIPSLDEWLKSLRIKVRVEELNESNLQRTAQLLNKTNQMNLTTRRMTASDLVKWLSQPNRKVWTFHVSDKFGDSGLTGVTSLEVEKESGRIIDFVLSCRVMGRKVEETMLWTATDYARSAGLKEISAKYVPTAKNRPCLAFFENSAFQLKDDNTFTWPLNRDFKVPEAIEIEIGAEGQFAAPDPDRSP